MIWLLWKLITLPLRLLVGTARVGTLTGYRTGRLFGYRRLFVFAAGVAVGLLLAPIPGAKLRDELRRRLRDLTPDLAQQVRDRLSHDPRTWHLPQPDVEVIGSRVVLRGSVPHETGRQDFDAVARSVAGVTHVDNRVAISDVG